MSANAQGDFDTEPETDAKRLEQCRKWRDKAIAKNPGVKFMMQKLSQMGCPIASDKLYCECCGPALSGGYRADRSITLCSNNLFSKEHTGETLVHELIHAFDDCRANVNWRNCEHLACSEVRAAALSGDCRWWNEFRRGNRTLGGQFLKCVRRRAELSVKMSSSCGEAKAESSVDAVIETCLKDTEPFQAIP